MLKSVVFVFFLVSKVLSFTPNCVGENQYKYYSFPVEGCSDYLSDLCMPVRDGRFQIISTPKIVKIKETTVLPTCAFYNVKSLRHIYGVKSNIKVLARGSFVDLPNLKSINLAYNQLIEIRDKIFQNVTTEILDLSWNNIVSVDPDAFKEVHGMRYLNLSRNSLLTLPISQLSPFIVNLNLAYNKLSRVAINSVKFQNLTNVDLSNNDIKNIAISFFYPVELFDLSNNDLADIDYVEIMSVETFRIGSNQFKTVPRYLENINANKINIYPNPWKCEELPLLWSAMTSLNYNIETTGAESETMEICTNITNNRMTSQKEKSCINDRACPTNKVCKTGKCLDPCDTFCHKSSVCKTKNHQFSCSCPKGLKTNPMDLTGSCNNVECYTNSHCRNNKFCIDNHCAIMETPTNENVPNASESEHKEMKPWWFEDIPHEEPVKLYQPIKIPYMEPIELIQPIQSIEIKNES